MTATAVAATSRVLRRREAPVVLLMVGVLVALSAAPTENGSVTCLMRNCTGVACPGCGMTRATGRLVRGDFAGSFQFHPYLIALVVQAVGFAAWKLWWGSRPLEARHGRAMGLLLIANLGLLFVVWAVRLATGHLDYVY